MTLSVDYMPQSLDEMVGNDAGIQSLRSKLTSEDIPRSYFFTGDPGCGKTTVVEKVVARLPPDCAGGFATSEARRSGSEKRQPTQRIAGRAALQISAWCARRQRPVHEHPKLISVRIWLGIQGPGLAVEVQGG